MQPSIIHFFDITGATLSFLSTIFYVRASIMAWPVGLAAISINLTLYGITGIYGDMSLEFLYLLATVYGWYQWAYRGEKKQALPVTHLTLRHGMVLGLLAVIGIIALSQFLIHFTNSQVPYWDATTTILSLVAQWLVCKKIIQNWILWFIVDAMYIGLYFLKDIPAHSVLNFVYLGLAVAGYIHWHKLMNQKPISKSTSSSTPAEDDVTTAVTDSF